MLQKLPRGNLLTKMQGQKPDVTTGAVPGGQPQARAPAALAAGPAAGGGGGPGAAVHGDERLAADCARGDAEQPWTKTTAR